MGKTKMGSQPRPLPVWGLHVLPGLRGFPPTPHPKDVGVRRTICLHCPGLSAGGRVGEGALRREGTLSRAGVRSASWAWGQALDTHHPELE